MKVVWNNVMNFLKWKYLCDLTVRKIQQLEGKPVLSAQELHTEAKCLTPPLPMVMGRYCKQFTLQVNNIRDLSSRKQKSDAGTIISHFPLNFNQ
jgi:hypothetical protein